MQSYEHKSSTLRASLVSDPDLNAVLEGTNMSLFHPYPNNCSNIYRKNSTGNKYRLRICPIIILLHADARQYSGMLTCINEDGFKLEISHFCLVRNLGGLSQA